MSHTLALVATDSTTDLVLGVMDSAQTLLPVLSRPANHSDLLLHVPLFFRIGLPRTPPSLPTPGPTIDLYGDPPTIEFSLPCDGTPWPAPGMLINDRAQLQGVPCAAINVTDPDPSVHEYAAVGTPNTVRIVKPLGTKDLRVEDGWLKYRSAASPNVDTDLDGQKDLRYLDYQASADDIYGVERTPPSNPVTSVHSDYVLPGEAESYALIINLADPDGSNMV